MREIVHIQGGQCGNQVCFHRALLASSSFEDSKAHVPAELVDGVQLVSLLKSSCFADWCQILGGGVR